MLVLSVGAVLVGVFLIFTVLVDTFEAIILPRSIDRPIRLSRVFYDWLWRFWRLVAGQMNGNVRETWLGAFGPLALIILVALWAVFQIFAFGLIYWGLGIPITGRPEVGIGEYLFISGGNFFTVGSDYTPSGGFGHFLTVFEAGLGFGFLAVVISYLPILAGAFAKREVLITLFDARAGSPPSALELLKRYSDDDDMEALTTLLRDWEIWSAELLEAYLSYPVLAFYRSQHERQSWLSSITTIMDVCALTQLGFQEEHPWAPGLRRQAKLTFAMARHACVDLALILKIPPLDPPLDRLPHVRFLHLQQQMEVRGISLCSRVDAEADLGKLRLRYEGYVQAIGRVTLLDVPSWIIEGEVNDNWQNSAFASTDHFSSDSDQSADGHDHA